MAEIIDIPAGVIQPRDLIMWLIQRRDQAREYAADADRNGDWEMLAQCEGAAVAFQEVLLHVQYGETRPAGSGRPVG